MKNKHFLGLYFWKIFFFFCLKNNLTSPVPCVEGGISVQNKGKELLSSLNQGLVCQFLDFQVNSRLLVPMEFLFDTSPPVAYSRINSPIFTNNTILVFLPASTEEAQSSFPSSLGWSISKNTIQHGLDMSHLPNPLKMKKLTKYCLLWNSVNASEINKDPSY